MLIRLAQITWWFGTAALALLLYAYFNDGPDHPHFVRQLMLLGVTTLPAWLVSLLLGGSFFTPPRSDRE